MKYRYNLNRYLNLIVYLAFASHVFSINPPKNGGGIPQKYIDIFKSQNIIHNHEVSLHDNLSRSGFDKPLSPPSNYNLPVLLVGFSNNDSNSEVVSKEEFQEHLFGNNISGSLTDYYNEISYGKFNLTGNVYGWYESSFTEEMAVENTSGFIIDILDQANADINFSEYDNDNDGVVDGLMIVFPGLGADEDGADSGHIWPHMSTLWQDDTPYSGVYDGVSFSKYAVCPEQRKIGSSQSREIRPIGVFAHEFGHVLGLPDLYERSTEDETAISEGIGEWCLMASGSWNGSDGDTPAHMSAWCKYKLGWSDPIVLEAGNYQNHLNENGYLELQNVAENDNQIYKVYADSYRWNEYFLLENRQLVNFDSQLNGSGLLLYHVDENQYWGMNNFGGGSNNDDYSHKLVDIEEADGYNHLDNSTNRGDSGDPYPGSSNNSAFNQSSSPNNYNYSGLSSSFTIDNISALDGLIEAEIFVPIRDGEVLSYSSGIGSGYGYSEIQDHTYAVKFTAPDNVFLTKVDIGLSQDDCDIDISIYRSMTAGYFSDNPLNKLFSISHQNVSSGWNVFDIDPIEFNSGETFYVVVSNKNSTYGWTTDLEISDFNNYSYYQNPSSGLFNTSSFGNLSIRARFDNDGTLANTTQLPSNIEIVNAYPNPFNPIVNLSYSIPVSNQILVNVYDTRGRLVSELENSFQHAGSYNLIWDASDISSGIYFAKYIVGEQSYTQKLSLLK